MLLRRSGPLQGPLKRSHVSRGSAAAKATSSTPKIVLDIIADQAWVLVEKSTYVKEVKQE